MSTFSSGQETISPLYLQLEKKSFSSLYYSSIAPRTCERLSVDKTGENISTTPSAIILRLLCGNDNSKWVKTKVKHTDAMKYA
jgi:hypothetical protein